MERADLINFAELYVEEYRSILNIDPYYKISVELVESDKASECLEASSPATWLIRLDPTKHVDVIDIQMSIIGCVLSILFRDIPASKKTEEVMSKLTHAILQLTVQSQDEEQISEDLPEDLL